MKAYYQFHPAADSKDVGEFLAKRAISQGKQIGFESPSYEAFVTSMAEMSPTAQSEYISWLFSYLDDQDRGDNDKDAGTSWETGHPPAMTRSLKRMIEMPELYSAMQVRRSRWWANKIDDLVSAGGQTLIAIVQLHLIGPASIPNQLKARGHIVHTI